VLTGLATFRVVGYSETIESLQALPPGHLSVESKYHVGNQRR